MWLGSYTHRYSPLAIYHSLSRWVFNKFTNARMSTKACVKFALKKKRSALYVKLWTQKKNHYHNNERYVCSWNYSDGYWKNLRAGLIGRWYPNGALEISKLFLKWKEHNKWKLPRRLMSIWENGEKRVCDVVVSDFLIPGKTVCSFWKSWEKRATRFLFL